MQSSPQKETLCVREAMARGVEYLKRSRVESPQLDMSLILAHVLGTDRLGIYTDLERPLDETERTAARALLARRAKREPMAYILGQREFYGLTLRVASGVLIPRPETELLVEFVIDWAGKQAVDTLRMADIGTGSGAIALAGAAEIKHSRWLATDTSPEALAIAKDNAERLALTERVAFAEGAFCAPLAGHIFDAICANPPYIDAADRPTLAPEITEYEPVQALFSEHAGLAHLETLIEQAPTHLRSGGLLVMEHGQGQGQTLCEVLAHAGHWHAIQSHHDYNGIDRFVSAEKR